MPFVLSEKGVRFPDTGWAATYEPDSRSFRGKPVQVLNLAQTGGNLFTQYDVGYAVEYGSLPPFDALVDDPRWGYVGPRRQDGTVPRDAFIQWRHQKRWFPGRPLRFSPEQIAEIRATRTFRDVDKNFQLSYQMYRLISLGVLYWWVQTGDPNWMGRFW